MSPSRFSMKIYFVINLDDSYSIKNVSAFSYRGG